MKNHLTLVFAAITRSLKSASYATSTVAVTHWSEMFVSISSWGYLSSPLNSPRPDSFCVEAFTEVTRFKLKEGECKRGGDGVGHFPLKETEVSDD